MGYNAVRTDIITLAGIIVHDINMKKSKQVQIKNIVANILVLVLGYTGMILLINIDTIFVTKTFTPLPIAGILLIIFGIAIRIWSTVAFSKKNVEILEMNKHPALVTSGPYKYSRNPLYIGILAVTLGFVFLAGSWIGVIFTVLFGIFWNMLIKYREEKNLKLLFGKEFSDYMAKTRRWL
jgi:protein-S-isoprenylcysteine O-methyltransferase Ste14